MKRPALLLAVAGLLPVFAAQAPRVHATPPAPSAAAPCTTVADACTEWVPLGKGKARAMVYRSYSLTAPNTAIRRALIMVHGTNRNADHYFGTALSAGFLAGALGDTVIISPAIRSADRPCNDKLQPDEVNWSCRGDSWRSGGTSLSDPNLASFDFVDAILRELSNKKTFPNLNHIVVAGHSAGGQFVNRYEMANRVHDTLGVAVSYVVANPSSYAWPEATRPLPVDDADPKTAPEAWKTDTPGTHFSFGPFDASADPKYDQWPYGLEGRTGGYTAGISDDQLRKQLIARPTTYLLGQVDTLPLGGFDSSPSAIAQGPTRRARGEAFVQLLHSKMGAGSKIIVVPECGHNDRCIYTTDAVLPLIFPRD